MLTNSLAVGAGTEITSILLFLNFGERRGNTAHRKNWAETFPVPPQVGENPILGLAWISHTPLGAKVSNYTARAKILEFKENLEL